MRSQRCGWELACEMERRGSWLKKKTFSATANATRIYEYMVQSESAVDDLFTIFGEVHYLKKN